MPFAVILPKSLPNLEDFRSCPLFFLAGPILGADDWQAEMTEILKQMTGGDCLVVNPSRYPPEHPLYAHRLDGSGDFFDSQTLWERHYLTAAGEAWPLGCILFWLREESRERPRTDGEPYARDTRGEIGEWRWRLKMNPQARVVMGAEPNFPGLSVIRKINEDAVPGKLPILPSMEAVARRAVSLALNPR